MSAPAFVGDPAAHGDLIQSPPVPESVGAASKSDVARQIASGTSALSASMTLERGAGFLANVLAARIAGPAVFGAYSLAISTANSISTYAAGGIGATAVRFSGKYPYGTPQYGSLARVLIFVSLISSVLGAGVLYFCARPISLLLHKPSGEGLFHWAALSVAGIILVECARGFFVGQRRLRALLLLSGLIGVGMIIGLTITAATEHATYIVTAQATATLAAVMICCVFASKLGLRPLSATREPIGKIFREVTAFGLIQMGGLVSANLAGWWLIAVIARSDSTLRQVSFFAIASQLRNIVGILPGVLTEGSYAAMARTDGDHRTPQNVMAICGFAATGASLLLAIAGAAVMPWALHLVYGKTFAGAVMAANLGLALAVVHMGNAPFAARLTIVNIRLTGVINTLWAIGVALAATFLFMKGGDAAEAMAVFLVCHLLSALLVLVALARQDYLPAGVKTLFALGSAAVAVTVMMSWAEQGQLLSPLIATVCLILLFLSVAASLYAVGKKHGWLPSRELVRVSCKELMASVRSSIAAFRARSSYDVV